MSDPDLPVDPDVEVDPGRRRERPVHLRPGAVGLVVLGGVVGTAAREAVGLLVPPVGRLPLAILLINLVGAFVLGALLEALVRRGPDEGRRRDLRLLLGTGVLGGFTTYSAFASDTAALLGGGEGGTAVFYALCTVVVGALATTGGIALSAALHSRRPGRGEEAGA